jgi:hypothetical protein
MIAGISGGLSRMSDNLQPDPYTASLSISRLQGRDVDTSTLIWECCQSTAGGRKPRLVFMEEKGRNCRIPFRGNGCN